MCVPSYAFVIAEPEAGQRLDHYLVARALPFTRSRLKRLIDEGHCWVNDETSRPAHKLRAGDHVRLAPPPPVVSDRVEPEAIALSVLFEDADLIVVDKPAGMVVHPGPGHARGTLVAALLAHCEGLSVVGGELRAGIVHRLDKLTSGVLVASKSDAAHVGLAGQFQRHSVTRSYLAIVRGTLPAAGRFDTLHGRHPTDRKRYSSRVSRGRRAVTHYRTLEPLGRCALVEARLETGRTHQVRVHFADHGTPLLGDPVYGGRCREPALRSLGEQLGRQALHARRLAFEHPLSGESMDFSSPLPADMQQVLAELRGSVGETS